MAFWEDRSSLCVGLPEFQHGWHPWLPGSKCQQPPQVTMAVRNASGCLWTPRACWTCLLKSQGRQDTVSSVSFPSLPYFRFPTLSPLLFQYLPPFSFPLIYLCVCPPLSLPVHPSIHPFTQPPTYPSPFSLFSFCFLSL